MEFLILVASFALVVFATLFAMAQRYKRCPSDKILVVYGKIAGGQGLSAKCYHGGAAFVWPIIQDYQFLNLTPIPIDIKLEGALSQQNIRVNTPSTFTVGISTEPGVMENAAERMLGLSPSDIQELALCDSPDGGGRWIRFQIGGPGTELFGNGGVVSRHTHET